ncbi:MAG: alpha/beta hydrolase [Archangium sp.]|nr:alpha/beta hydrolase [Archangium sp.]
MAVSRKRSGVVEAADGTPITFHTHGTSGGPVVLLTNGIGTTENFWRHLVDDLSIDHTVVHWDYRGHGNTPRSASGDYSLATQADDLARVTRRVRESGRPPVHIAFSMGVAVLLELYRKEPGLVRAMALLAGAPDAPGTGTALFRVPGSLAAARAMAALATPVVPFFAPVVKAFLRSRLPYPFARMMGVLQPHAPRQDIDEFLQGVASMDPLAYWRTLRGLLAARGSDVLPTVSVPVLIVAAAQDLLMPLSQVEKMRRGLPHASYVLIDEAGHAGLVEKGPEMARAVRDLLLQVPG